MFSAEIPRINTRRYQSNLKPQNMRNTRKIQSLRVFRGSKKSLSDDLGLASWIDNPVPAWFDPKDVRIGKTKSMKARILWGFAALLSVCLCVKFAPAVFERCRSGGNSRTTGLARRGSSRSLAARTDRALADLRTAAATVRYLLEPEPDQQPIPLMVASNSPAQRPARAGATPPTLASNAALQMLACSNAAPSMPASNVAGQKVLGSAPS